ncbi:nitronate monooxygenase [Bacillus gobiensis]|uniref:NAD(P)H-dependent flavin oxidoreductase n=1 Tax=Bacillus gobiensis TaxID=1441095 RepID=UPI003D210735
MWNDNLVTQRLKIEYPIIQAGMAGGITTPDLVAAVSNSGGLGTLGAGYMSSDEVAVNIQKIKQLTSNSFGVNVFIPEYPEVKKEEIEEANKLLDPFRKELQIKTKNIPEQSESLFEKQMEVILEQRVPVCSFTFGIASKELIRDLKKENITVIGTATTVEEAMINEEKGVDLIVVQGSEAGGHRGTFSVPFENAMIGTMALIPQAADHIHTPIIAAGGIMDGRGVLASQVLGAQGVQMGTAFVTCLESGAKKQHKEAILNTSEEKAVMTSAFSGKPARGIDNQFIQAMKGHEDKLLAYPAQNTLTNDIRKEAAKQNRPEWMSMWSGQAPRLSKNKSARDIMSEIVSQVDHMMKEKTFSYFD